MFKWLLQDSEASKFIIDYKKIDSNNKFCRGNILGINVDRNKEIISEKFYFTTSFLLNERQILYFLPTARDLIEVYKFVDLSDNPICRRGVTFAIKKSKDGIIRQFHFKVPPAFYNTPAMTKHKTVFLPQEIFTGDELYGISYEYRQQKSFLKNYVYFKSNKAKEYFSQRLGIKIDCETIEYTETNFGSKIILINSQCTPFKKFFPTLSQNLIYKNYGTYLSSSEYSAYIYPKDYLKLEEQGEVDTISLL